MTCKSLCRPASCEPAAAGKEGQVCFATGRNSWFSSSCGDDDRAKDSPDRIRPPSSIKDVDTDGFHVVSVMDNTKIWTRRGVQNAENVANVLYGKFLSPFPANHCRLEWLGLNFPLCSQKMALPRCKSNMRNNSLR